MGNKRWMNSTNSISPDVSSGLFNGQVKKKWGLLAVVWSEGGWYIKYDCWVSGPWPLLRAMPAYACCNSEWLRMAKGRGCLHSFYMEGLLAPAILIAPFHSSYAFEYWWGWKQEKQESHLCYTPSCFILPHPVTLTPLIHPSLWALPFPPLYAGLLWPHLSESAWLCILLEHCLQWP